MRLSKPHTRRVSLHSPFVKPQQSMSPSSAGGGLGRLGLLRGGGGLGGGGGGLRRDGGGLGGGGLRRGGGGEADSHEVESSTKAHVADRPS